MQSQVQLHTAAGECLTFDAVVLATHSDTSMQLLDGWDPKVRSAAQGPCSLCCCNSQILMRANPFHCHQAKLSASAPDLASGSDQLVHNIAAFLFRASTIMRPYLQHFHPCGTGLNTYTCLGGRSAAGSHSLQGQ